MKVKTFLRYNWIIVYLIGIALFATAYLGLTTQKGLNLAFTWVQPHLPGNLKITSLTGSLLGPIQIENLHYTDPENDLVVTSAQLAWHWRDLLRGQFVIHALSIDQLTFFRKVQTVTSKAKNFKLPWILEHIHLDSLDVHHAVIHYADDTLILNGSLHKQWNFNAQLTIPKLDKLVKKMHGSLFLQGKINGDRIAPRLEVLLAKTNLICKNWQLRQLQGKFYFDGQKNKNLFFTLQAAQFRNPSISLNPIQLSGNVIFAPKNNLSSVNQIITSIKRSDIAIKLTSSAQLPALGIQLNDIAIELYTNKTRLHGSGQLTSGKGVLTLQSTSFLNEAHFPTVIDLQGNNVEISHTDEYKIIASPTLHVQGDIQQLTASGKIFFPKANIKIRDNTNLVELSSDVVLINKHKPKKPFILPFTYTNDIQLQLGNEINFSYHGLDTKVTGLLHIHQTTGHPILATGELTLVNGNYTYYGQQLMLQPHSSLNFANSPITNPSLNITASKKVWVLPNTGPSQSNIGSTSFIPSELQTAQQPITATVGVRLQGFLENPQITLYADPANIISSQSDILSYLATGQPSNQLSANSLQLLLNAAAQAGDSDKVGFSQLINAAEKKIGIDQLTISANPIFNPNTNSLQQNTSLILGKNFSPRLNISYSLGLLDPISILKINYLLNKNFSLQGTTSNFENGVDLLYKIEKS